MPKYFSFDCEADGPAPGLYSMLSFGAVAVDDLSQTFYVELIPTGDSYIPELYDRVGLNRYELLKNGTHPKKALEEFERWLYDVSGKSSPRMIADNAGFDWMFICHYFHRYLGRNPFGFSCTSLTSLYKGWDKDMKASFKHLRVTQHDHNALNDAIGNAEALRTLRKRGLTNLF